MLVISVVFIAGAIAFLSRHLLSFWLLLANTTFLHLVLITVFVLVKALLKGLFALALLEANTILIE